MYSTSSTFSTTTTRELSVLYSTRCSFGMDTGSSEAIDVHWKLFPNTTCTNNHLSAADTTLSYNNKSTIHFFEEVLFLRDSGISLVRKTSVRRIYRAVDRHLTPLLTNSKASHETTTTTTTYYNSNTSKSLLVLVRSLWHPTCNRKIIMKYWEFQRMQMTMR